MLWSDKSLTRHLRHRRGRSGIIAGLGSPTRSRRGPSAGRDSSSAEDTANHVIGGILMGFGGVTALGCTIGQGITGFSTLALGSILAFARDRRRAAAATMKYQYWRIERDA